MKTGWMFLLVLPALAAQAQDKTVKELQAEAARTIKKEEADTAGKNWRRGGLYNFNLAQGSLRNWAAGGDDFSLTLASVLNLYAFYKRDKHSWDNSLDFNLAYVRTTSLGSRKNDDRIDLLSKYGYAIAPKWNIAGLFNFRSQLFKGFTFSDGNKTFSSAFLSPAYILVSTGFDFKPNSEFSLFVSPLTARWVLVKNDSLSARGLYGVSPGEHSLLEVGAFLSANYLRALNKIITYKGRLDLFSNYRNHPENIDLFFANIFSAKLSKVLAVSWNLDLIYDDDVKLFGKSGTAPALQVKSLVGVGLLVKF